jgi:hypothetical protein
MNEYNNKIRLTFPSHPLAKEKSKMFRKLFAFLFIPASVGMFLGAPSITYGLPSSTPIPPVIFITPSNNSITLNSGQSITVGFHLERINTDIPASLNVESVPPGITAALSPQFLPATGSNFSLTLTAAENVTPAEATIEIRAVGGRLSSVARVAVNAVAAGQVRPAYQILTVVYAPPGTNGGRSSSQVLYGSGSTTGTVDSISNSFKEGVDVTASVGVTIDKIVNLGASGDFTASQTNTQTSQVSINKGANYQIVVAGPNADGINHSNDLIYLWLNPQLNVTVDHLGNVAWEIAVNGQKMDIQYVYVEWLQNPSSMPPGVAQNLATAGLTTADYAQILACDPFSSGATAIDSNRFVPTLNSFPYEPPLAAGDPAPTMTYMQTTGTTTTGTQEAQTQYGVSASVSAGIQTPISASLKVTGSLQWTNTSTLTGSNGSTQQANVTVGGPAFGYTGPTDILVYWDTVYSSFMFAFAPGNPSASGTVINSAGSPVPNQAMTLTVGGTTLSTFTDSRGQFNFYGGAPGQGTVTVKNQNFIVTVGAEKLTLHLNAPE